MNEKQHKGVFISLEGIEGAGKSTLLEAISEYLLQQDIVCCNTREPGGTALAERIRHFLLATENKDMGPDCELLLMFAARAEHIKHCIGPALARGEWVLCDRFVDASFAYQGGGRGLSLDWIETLSQHILGDVLPDITFFLDLKPGAGSRSRLKQRPALDRFEQQDDGFFERVRQIYIQRCQQDPLRIHRIDAHRPADVVTEEVLAQLAQRFAILRR